MEINQFFFKRVILQWELHLYKAKKKKVYPLFEVQHLAANISQIIITWKALVQNNSSAAELDGLTRKYVAKGSLL